MRPNAGRSAGGDEEPDGPAGAGNRRRCLCRPPGGGGDWGDPVAGRLSERSERLCFRAPGEMKLRGRPFAFSRWNLAVIAAAIVRA